MEMVITKLMKKFLVGKSHRYTRVQRLGLLDLRVGREWSHLVF
jgi:hypothetical protein